MPIAGYGGLIIDGKNNRVYPGAGGTVGGLTPGTRNIAWIAGAGETYQSYTPARTEELVRDPLVGIEDEIDPIYPGGGGGGGFGGGGGGGLDPVDPGGPIVTGGGGGPADSQPYEIMPTVTPQTLQDLIGRVLSGAGITRAGNNQPLFLYTPEQPQNQTGGNMRSWVILGVLVFVGYLIYKRVG